MPTPCTVIMNPAAGGYAEDTTAEVAAALEGYGFAPQVFLTRSPDDAALFARRACAERPDPLVIAGGGDGTVNGVLNGLVPGAATLAVLPLGTSNVLARELGIRSVGEALGRIARRETRPLSVGLLDMAGERRYFSLMAGIGFDGAVVAGVRLGEKRWLKEGAYILSAVRVLGNWERETLEIVADGERRKCHSAVICNSARYGGDFMLARDADIFSPGFRVVCIRSGDRRGYLRLALRILTGRGAAGPGVEMFAARELHFAGGMAIQADGDYIGRGPGSIRTVEGFARLIV
ncbi:MAG TPA: diacylglycerol kinase family protein [Geobacteraceae bacterium]